MFIRARSGVHYRISTVKRYRADYKNNSVEAVTDDNEVFDVDLPTWQRTIAGKVDGLVAAASGFFVLRKFDTDDGWGYEKAPVLAWAFDGDGVLVAVTSDGMEIDQEETIILQPDGTIAIAHGEHYKSLEVFLAAREAKLLEPS